MMVMVHHERQPSWVRTLVFLRFGEAYFGFEIAKRTGQTVTCVSRVLLMLVDGGLLVVEKVKHKQHRNYYRSTADGLLLGKLLFDFWERLEAKCLDRIVFTPLEFKDAIQISQPGQAIILDEGPLAGCGR